MIESAIEEFSRSLVLFLTEETKQAKTLLIKKHTDNLKTHGDLSFPNSIKSWHEYALYNLVTDVNITTILEATKKNSDDIVQGSKSWNLSVSKVKEEIDRVYLFLHRPSAIRVGLSEALRNNILITRRMCENNSRVVLDPVCVDKSDITSLRAKYVSLVLRNLCAVHEVDAEVLVTTKSSSKSEGHTVLCGTVLNAKSGAKEVDLKSDDYIRLRQEEMTLIAQHKYGVRAATDNKWKEFIAHLGESAAAFELLQTRPSGPVKINFESSLAGSSKGASFILYNCARLETIIRTYNDHVAEGTYPELPAIDDIDFNLLTQEDEWCLAYNYILGLPAVINNCVDVERCEFRPHNICSYLCSMVRVFSQYYRRVRILVEPRKHLLPTIFARMHLLIILNNTLKTCLRLLNIKSVSQM